METCLFFFFFLMESPTGLCRHKEELETVIIKKSIPCNTLITWYVCRYQCWLSWKRTRWLKTVQLLSFCLSHFGSRSASVVVKTHFFFWPRWQDANLESICIVNFLDVSFKRLTMTKLFKKRDRDGSWRTSNLDIFLAVRHFPNLISDGKH